MLNHGHYPRMNYSFNGKVQKNLSILGCELGLAFAFYLFFISTSTFFGVLHCHDRVDFVVVELHNTLTTTPISTKLLLSKAFTVTSCLCNFISWLVSALLYLVHCCRCHGRNFKSGGCYWLPSKYSNVPRAAALLNFFRCTAAVYLFLRRKSVAIDADGCCV